MPKVVLYGIDISPPVRACLLTLEALKIPYEYKIVNLGTGEHLTEEFRKHNPQHTVPVLEDNGVWLWDSHVICAYLVDKYSKDDTLYPKELVRRSQITQRLYFDASILYMALHNICKPMWAKNESTVSKEKVENLLDGYELVETFLGDNKYITGNTLTIADLCCVATVSSLHGIVELDMAKFPKTSAWVHRLSKLPYYEKANEKGVTEEIGILKSKLTEIDV